MSLEQEGKHGLTRRVGRSKVSQIQKFSKKAVSTPGLRLPNKTRHMRISCLATYPLSNFESTSNLIFFFFFFKP